MLTARLSHVALGVGDLPTARRFYEDRVGLRLVESTPEAERFGLGSGSHVLELAKGHGLGHFALEIADEDELSAVAERLAGQAGELVWSDCEGDHPRALRFTDPDGHRVELHGRAGRTGEVLPGPPDRPVGLHHITLSTGNVRALVDFYVSVLGFVVSDRMGERFMWMRCNKEHHTVAIVEGPPGGLDHYCYEVRDWNELKRWCDELASADVPITWGPGRHGPGNNLFIMFDDPDGVHIELSCEMERFWDGDARYPAPREWEAGVRTVNLWGPAPEWRRSLADSMVGSG